MLVLFGIGFFPVAFFIPPPSPAGDAAEVTRWYLDNLTGIRAGTVIMMFAGIFIAPWGAAVAAFTARTERGFPIVASLQVMLTGLITMLLVIFTSIWAAASFRAGTAAPDITQALNDLGYFTLLFAYPPFCLLVAAYTVSILRDRSEPPMFPRWVGYFNLWIVLLSVPSAVLVFFKTGPLAYDGILACYIPMAVVFIWFFVMTAMAFRALRRLVAAATLTTLRHTPEIRQSLQ
jgi:hypothetical protein